MPDTVLVTGAAGFVGRATAETLAGSGHSVVAISRSEPTKSTPGVRWRQCDLSDCRAVSELFEQEKPGALVSLAWHMGPGTQADAENYLWIGYSIDLLYAFAKNGGRRAVFCGSCAEYDWSLEKRMSERDTPLEPSNEYGRAKMALGNLFPSICDKLGLSGAWARPFFMYGPGEDPRRLVASVILSVLGERQAECTEGTQKLDFLHIDDVGSALAAILNSGIQGPVNIGSGQAVAVRDVVTEIATQLKRPDLIKLGAKPSRPDEPQLLEADIGRLSREVGWTPRFDLAQGIADTIAWWQAQPEQTKGRTPHGA